MSITVRDKKVKSNRYRVELDAVDDSTKVLQKFASHPNI